MRRRADFRGLVERLRTECAGLGVEPATDLLEELLAQRVQAMADLLRVQVATVFRSYAGGIDIPRLAAEIAMADRLRRREVAETPHVILDLAAVGRLVRSGTRARRAARGRQRHTGSADAAEEETRRPSPTQVVGPCLDH